MTRYCCWVCILMSLLLVAASCTPATPEKSPLVTLPAIPFPLSQTRSDLHRTTRSVVDKYRGSIIDTHVHLYPGGDGDQGAIQNIVNVLDESGVKMAIFMPTPNEGYMAARDGDNGAWRRRQLKAIGGAPESNCSVAVNISPTGWTAPIIPVISRKL